MIPIKKLIDLMAKQNIAQSSDLVGVSYTEIQAMQAYFQVEFPVIYKEFLSRCGRSAGHLAGWSAIYFDDLKEIAEEFQFCLAAINTQKPCNNPLPQKALLIAHYENHFDYIICDAKTPEVYRISFCNDRTQVSQFSQCFSTYMESMINAAASSNDQVAPFFIDECGNMIKDDLQIEAPVVD